MYTRLYEGSEISIHLDNSDPSKVVNWAESNSPDLTINKPGKYLATINTQMCQDSFYFMVIENRKPIPIFTRLDTNCSVYIGQKTNQNPIKITLNNKRLKLISTNTFYCSDSTELRIQDQCSSFYIPNVFSPDNNYINNVFKPISVGYSLLSLRIFNKWGQEIYEGVDAWDGTYQNKPCISGSYAYQIIMKNNLHNTFHYDSGTLQLIR